MTAAKSRGISSLGKYATDVMAILILVSACVAYGTGFFDSRINTVIDKNKSIDSRIDTKVDSAMDKYIAQDREERKQMMYIMLELRDRTARIEGKLSK